MLNTDDNKFVSNESIGAQLHTPPESFSDSFALFITKSLRFFADTLFRKRYGCLLYTSPSPRDRTRSRMPSSA